MPLLYEGLFELSSGQATSSVGYSEFIHMGEMKCFRLWNALLVCWLFKKGENVHLGKIKAWYNFYRKSAVPAVGLSSPPRQGIFKRKQRTGKLCAWHFILCGNKACNK